MKSNLALERTQRGDPPAPRRRVAPRLKVISPLAPRVLHSLPGRARLQLAGWNGEGARELESKLLQGRGILAVKATSVTRNVLIRFDPKRTNLETVRTMAGRIARGEAPQVSAERGRRLGGGIHQGMRERQLPTPGPSSLRRRRPYGRFLTLLPHLPKLFALLLSLLSAAGPLGLFVAGIEGLQLIAEIQAGWPA